MEENALIINIATILAKDIAFDQAELSKKSTQLLCENFPLLENDDEAFTFFLHQRIQSRKRRLEEATSPSKSDCLFKINLVDRLSSNVFETNLHLSKNTFKSILNVVNKFIDQITLNGRINEETIFSLGIWKLATDEHFEEISRRFRVPLDQCHTIVRSFWNKISENYETFIKWPNSQILQMQCLSSFQSVKLLKQFKNLFGIITIKRLDIFLESEDEETSVILQIICSADHTILDCYVQLASKYSFEASPIGQTLENNMEAIPADCYLIGDCNFPLKRYLMRPFEVECFRVERKFNSLLKTVINVSDQVLNQMTKRFNTLYALEAKDMTEVRKIIETICSLHNLCQKFDDKIVRYYDKSYSNSHYPIFNAIHNIKGSENDQCGKEIRLELMDKIVK